HAMVREGVVGAIGSTVDVVAQAEDVDDAVAAIASTRPDVVLLDVHLPSGTGADVITAVAARGVDPAPRYLALSVSDAPEDVIGLVRAGAQGYTTKRIRAGELLEAIDHVAVGNAVFSPRLAAFVLDAFRNGPGAAPVAERAEPDDLDLLSPREREVMRLLARGFTYREIAAELFISDRTVESHTSSVLRKLQLSNRHELTHWAARHHLL
ncbi:MAG: LuxR C-terminal-related transcriptional regulator, partial [Acidimicrobiales bacterium]